MEKIKSVKNPEDATRLLTAALKHEWAVSFEAEIRNQLVLHLGLVREHVFTQEALLANARRIKGLV